MMPSLNRVQLIGYLGKDPESRFTTTGKKVCSFSMAVSHRWSTADGENKEATEWFNIEAWGGLGEFAQSYLSKGRLVFVEGRFQTDRYEHEGESRTRTKVVALAGAGPGPARGRSRAGVHPGRICGLSGPPLLRD
jgi:single-strand DNA-binding protein